MKTKNGKNGKSFIAKVLTFFKSFIRHGYKGMPKADVFTINTRHDICFSCDSFDLKNSQCLECGCYISKKEEFLNKLAWEDQECPLDKW